MGTSLQKEECGMARPTKNREASNRTGDASRRALALVLVALAGACGIDAAWAHQDRTGCSSTGVTLMIETFRADRVTPLPVSQGVSECETISYRVVLSKPQQDTVCAFEQGFLSLRTPDGVVHELTPRDGAGRSLIPCLGGTIQDPTLTPPAGACSPSVNEFLSGFVDYQIRPADVASGMAVALAQYVRGLLHINMNNLPDAANGSTPIPTLVRRCPPDTECIDNFCDPRLDDGVRLGLCTSVNRADSTPCTDADGNRCTMAGCEAGTCAQSHVTVTCNGPCLSGLCNPSTGACAPAPDSTTCADVDGNTCTVAGCEAGVCVQRHVLAGDSSPCADTDANGCTRAGCEAGLCVQRHILAADSTPCPDSDGSSCTTAGCEAGVCVQPHISTDCSGDCESGICDPVRGCIRLPDSTPCGDADDTLCTIAGCEAGVCIQDHLEVSKQGLPDCGPLPTAPCSVTVSSPARSFTKLQAAIDAANDGATIRVSGLCQGAVLIDGRNGLVIEGTPPASNTCPAPGELAAELSAAVRANDGTVFKVRDSQNVIVRYLKIVEGPGDCVKFTRAMASTLNCNCVAGCALVGVELNGGMTTELSQNLIKNHGDDGVVLLGGTSKNTLTENTIEQNGDDGIDLEGSRNDVLGNIVRANGADGIDLDEANENRVIGNAVLSNGCIPTQSEDSGIELRNSDNNEIDENVIERNTDGLANEIFCKIGSSGNVGSNVPPNSPCR
jgi:parallel beta-helix repeat protein